MSDNKDIGMITQEQADEMTRKGEAFFIQGEKKRMLVVNNSVYLFYDVIKEFVLLTPYEKDKYK